MTPRTRARVVRVRDDEEERRMATAARQTWFQYVTPFLVSIIFGISCWYFSGLNSNLQDFRALLVKLDKANDLGDQRMKSLEATKASRDSQLGIMQGDINDLKLQLGLLRGGVRSPDLPRRDGQ